MSNHDQFAWLKKHTYIYLIAIIVVVWVQIITQLFYPYDTALPGARLAGQHVAGQSRVDLAANLQKEYQSKTITIKTPSSSYSKPLIELGATLDGDTMAKQLTDYPTWQRFIPFTVYLKRPSISSYRLSFNSSVLQKQSHVVAAALSVKPVNAGLAITDGRLNVTEAKDGQAVSPEQVVNAVKKHRYNESSLTIQVPSTSTAPTIKDASIATVRKNAEDILRRQYIVRLPNGDEVTPSKKTIAKWLVLSESDGEIEVRPSKPAIKRYIASVNKKVAVNAKPIQVTLRNGNEVGRTEGKDGVTILSDDLLTKLTNAIAGSEPSVTMDVLTGPVKPAVVYSRTYSSSQAGLRAYVNYVTSAFDIHIALQQIGGNGWSASARAYDSIPSASTYKLYVAMWLFYQINKDKIEWSDPWLDTTVSECFDRMTIASTNPCAVAWLEGYGRDKMNKFVHARGFSTGTDFTLPDATHSTAADLLKFMIGLNNGSIVSGSQRDRLLHSLSVHPYRYGVPTGSAGRVYDKVGFLWDYVHDAAIVKHPKGTYVAVIMTKAAGGYAKIAEITRQLETIMYP